MKDFIKQFADGVFEPETVTILTDAFDEAWEKLQASRAPFAAEDYAPAAREILARHIIKAARAGDRGQRQLADGTLIYLSQHKMSRTPPPQ